MGLTSRFEIAEGGPRGGTNWDDAGGGQLLATIAGSTTPTTVVTTTQPGLIPISIVTRPNPFVSNGVSAVITNQDVLDQTNVIQSLYGFQVAASVLQAATVHLTLALSVYRTIGVTSGTYATVTSVTLSQNLTQTIPSGSTVTFTKVDGSASTTATLSAAANQGQAILAISSTNLTGYLAGSYVTMQVGGAAAFGWTAGAGAGTPAFPLGGSVMAPAVLTNTALVVGSIAWAGPSGPTAANSGFVPLQAGDVLALNVVTDSSTVTLQPMYVQLLVS